MLRNASRSSPPSMRISSETVTARGYLSSCAVTGRSATVVLCLILENDIDLFDRDAAFDRDSRAETEVGVVGH
jgi:hypothetical protein